ncbi:helix-turn-helix domain-containing protein [Roseibacterium sp. SDUM158016]|uniref:winged helix-turn-helix domain-containing protein n=1 Tax=Roseicyclus sediminis TaxID=2980997 RepID=UPI0021D0BDD7|nr:helix-turn-helix domain-containing protein [Roseibacterium sp. SDUM158016]MCU4652418.1 helix-turn-helix domain-containing protein [Roseibacterium sp. SDUM158016]
MPEPSSFVSETRIASTRVIQLGMAAIVAILVMTAILLFVNLPDADAFNAAIADIFVSADVRDPDATRMLEIMAETGTTFSGVLESYRAVMFVLMVFAAALLIACLVFLGTIVTLNRRIGQIERQGIQVSSLILSREERVVLINNLEFKLTDAAMETLSVLAEARLDDEVLTGAQIEAMVSGRAETDVDEAAGATRIKRLRDTLGNQIVSELLIKNIARRGYVLAIEKDVIRML